MRHPYHLICAAARCVRLTLAPARQAAAGFEVSPSAPIKLMQRVRQTGSTAPAKSGGCRPALLAEYKEVLRELTGTRKGITLGERVGALQLAVKRVSECHLSMSSH